MPRYLVAALMGASLLTAPAAFAQRYETDPLAFYEQFGDERIRSIEYDLIWIGGTDAVTNGIIGKQSLAAIREFERSIGVRDDGVLRRDERARLAEAAQAARERVGYEIVVDEATGAQIGVPFGFVGEPVRTRLGARYAAPSGIVEVETYHIPGRLDLREIYRRQLSRDGREVTYEVFRDNWFVVAGREGDRRFYTRARSDGTEVRAYTISYLGALKPELDPTVVAMSNDFEAFAADPVPEGAAGYAPTYDEAPCPGIIRVARGDTLRRIAERCGTTVQALRRANGGLRPRDLQAGQSLVIPESGATLPPLVEAEPAPEPTYAPTAIYLPRRPVEGGRVTVSATGFPPDAEIDVGFSRREGRFRPIQTVRADDAGRVELRLALPDDLIAGDAAAVALATPGGDLAAVTERFTVRERRQREPVRQEISVLGMLTTEGAACPAMRAVDGSLYLLSGEAIDYAPGTPVQIAGYAMPAGECGEAGQTVEVERIARR